MSRGCRLRPIDFGRTKNRVATLFFSVSDNLYDCHPPAWAAARAGVDKMALSYDEISEIFKIIDESSCDEFVLETGDIKLVVRRRGAADATPAIESSQSTLSASAPPETPGQLAPQPAAASAATAANVVTAPMVGTFYRAPSPDAPPFVEVGSKVKKGDPICIIEVMKLFTTIHAEWSGTVTEIGAENAKLAEYGQMLFVITPD
jgi:acetyl-CoA carboxylase biotin carboxyl carrier protein